MNLEKKVTFLSETSSLLFEEIVIISETMSRPRMRLSGSDWQFVPAGYLRREGVKQNRRADVLQSFKNEDLDYNSEQSVGKAWLVFALKGKYTIPETGTVYPYNSVSVSYPDKEPGEYEVTLFYAFVFQEKVRFETLEDTVGFVKGLKEE